MDGAEGSRTGAASSGARLSVWVVEVEHDYEQRELALDLLTNDGLDVIAHSGDVATSPNGVTRTSPDALVLLGDAQLLAVLTEISRVRDRLPQAAIVIVAPVPSPHGNGVRGALRAGARGFTLASRMADTLAITVRAACAGQIAVPQDLLDHTAPPTLSFREKQVLGMVVLGFANQEIAHKLHLTQSTVKSHLSSSFRKLGVRSRQEAAALILDTRSGLGPGILTSPRESSPAQPSSAS